MDNNEWRHVKSNPGAAHLWEMVYKKFTIHGYDVLGYSCTSKCRIISRLEFDETTILLANDINIKKCKKCLAITKRSAPNPTAGGRMNQKFSASMEFQRTDGGIPSLRPLCPVCRAPEKTPQPLCPVCRAPVEIYTVYSGGQISEQPRCRSHGDVAAICDPPGFAPPINAATIIPGNVWDGEGP